MAYSPLVSATSLAQRAPAEARIGRGRAFCAAAANIFYTEVNKNDYSTVGGFAVEEFLSNVLANMLAALAVATLLTVFGYVFRNKIKRIFISNDLAPSNVIPRVSIESTGPFWDTNMIKYCSILVESKGKVSLSKIRLYVCFISKSSLSITPLDVKAKYKWINDGNGERVQYNIPLSMLDKEGKTDRRLFVQMLDNKGVKYRRTAYLSDECNVSPQSIMRVRRMLPKRSIQAVSSNQVEKLINKYTLDIAKG
ncbi:MAG: hypothetical protein KH015_06555 [Gordonibacter pamelaeae]|uniref:hypothetical protein n=2 Tax=Gordonibacter pamelaeae TaxID=471189 RepID=UPI0015F04B20|nr:hypothetical protein [Gordonibacter pamelaeae]MBS4895427.1 hypothetical protein [Gordonibacter pamelaeae]MCB6311778.1 hypothetical protein [Gordonibacter pamelaeae]HJH74777.1 hypothetical protein [Eggerthellaceae bacterium]